jgi:glycosyltransferase involved in cell wall biosynthesis
MSEPIPLVSIVTAVCNGGPYLRPSLESTLAQQGVACEFIIVDDGSTDETAEVLTEVAARDKRVRVIGQDNQGLTAALIRGCAEARGEFIARHDADDLSLPGRLLRQVEAIRDNPQAALVSCWSRAIGPGDELLFSTCGPFDEARAQRQLIEGNNGPCHGSVLFRRSAYQAVGGYRPAFRYAQDWDLWLRMVALGPIVYVPDYLYAYRFRESSISSRRRSQQLRLRELALLCRQARLRGEVESPHLAEAARVSAEPAPAGANAGDGSYFIGKLLLDRRDRRALPYLWRSVRQRPGHLRGWAALAVASLLCRSSAEPAMRLEGTG